jgi:phage recombination protein Bet
MVPPHFVEHTMTTRKQSSASAPETLPALRIAPPAEAHEELGLDRNIWKLLTDSIFPSARTAEGILLAVRYCRARKLDILRRPVHVVPMYSKALGREVETVWPGIADVQTTAARTGEWAGMDPPRFGPDQTRTFTGKVKRDDAWVELTLTVTFPAWCEVTVYRMIQGTRCPFTETVWWEEAYSRLGGLHSEVPTDMWVKRPRGQLLKCAKAASLRAAFPEEADYTAEEMAGKVIEADALIVPEAEGLTGTDAADRAEPPDPPVSEEIRAQVSHLIARAAKAGAWGQAEVIVYLPLCSSRPIV